MRAEQPLEWLRGRGENLREGRAALRSERRAGRFEAVGADPGGLTGQLMRGPGPVRPSMHGGSAIGALGNGMYVKPGTAQRWFRACMGLAIEGFLLWAVGWLLDRFFGFGAGLMLFGSIMWLVAFVGMLMTPVVWAAELAAKGVRESRGREDHPA